ncbi:MAG: CerR family C-terminal domain-containing protein [Phycisphaerae bacterium]|nr:CerR family C-terminal domain-containing protein [Phycisphaerae bacterium]
MSDSDVDSHCTRRRVLEAAGEVFADKGFEKATIREIVDRANANLNAVNYYFRDKHGLYIALFEDAHELITGRDREVFEQISGLPPERQLREVVSYVLRGFILARPSAWHARLMFRELSEPTGVMEMMVERFIQPRFEKLADIVRQLATPNVPQLSVRLCAESIMAQCAHLAHRRAVVSRLIPELEYTPEGIEIMADHICSFSLAAARGLSRLENN